MLYLAIVIFSLIGYIFGSFLFSLIFGRIFLHIDIRQIGSGNAGATNLFRAAKNHKCRHIIAILSSILDMLKGYFAILLSLVIFKYCFDLSDNESWIIYFSGLFAIIGHCAPIFFLAHLIGTFSFKKAKRYSGGKGVSTYGGLFLAINPIITVTLFVFWIILKKITNYTSVSSIIGCFIAPFLILIKMWDVRGYLYYWFKLSINQDDLWFFLAIFFIFLVASWITIFMHKSNIGRLLKGNENKIRTKTLAK